jgi:transposase
MALLMVMGLSLLIYSLAELHLRQTMSNRDETIPDQKAYPTRRPRCGAFSRCLKELAFYISSKPA